MNKLGVDKKKEKVSVNGWHKEEKKVQIEESKQE